MPCPLCKEKRADYSYSGADIFGDETQLPGKSVWVSYDPEYPKNHYPRVELTLCEACGTLWQLDYFFTDHPPLMISGRVVQAYGGESLSRIQELRQAIRAHRDQKGDDRCWLDDYLLWKVLPDSPEEPAVLPSLEEMMKLCEAFFTYRQSATADPVPESAITDPELWDADLLLMDNTRLAAEVYKLELAIRLHRDVKGRERTLDDDRELYLALPEKVPADFRLPPKDAFLGEAKKPYAGCPSFWRSHEGCACVRHNLHTWGPCKC